MIEVDSVLGLYSLETGAFWIGWFVLILSVMIFYADFVLILVVSSMDIEMIRSYLIDTNLEKATKEGDEITHVRSKFQCLFSIPGVIVALAFILFISSVAAICSLFLVRAVETVSEWKQFDLFVVNFLGIFQRSQVMCQPAMIYFAFITFCSLYGFWELNIWVILSFFLHFYFHVVVSSLGLKFSCDPLLDLSTSVNYRSFEAY